MVKNLLLFLLSLTLIIFVHRIVNSQIYSQPPVLVMLTNDWSPFVAQFHEEGALSFIWDMNPGSQTFEIDYTDVDHWTRTILSSTVDGAAKATAILDGNIVTLDRPAMSDTYTMTVDPNYAPNEWLSYLYLSNLQKKPTVVLREGPEPGLVTAVETFERPCFPLLTKEGVKECGKDQKNSVVTREFTYRAEDYILTKLVSRVDGAVTEDVTLEKLTFK